MIDLAEKHAEGDFLREVGEWTLQRLKEMEVEARIGAKPHERTEDRSSRRNGYRQRALETRAGTMNLNIPMHRSGSYYPSFLEPRKRSEHALVAVIQEAYIRGVRTQKVDELALAMGMSGVSKSQVSRLCVELDGKNDSFLTRPIKGSWPYL